MTFLRSMRGRENSVPPKRTHTRDWALLLSAGLLSLIGIMAMASLFLIEAASKQSILDSLLPPGSPGHLLGTDELGRDVLLFTIAGTGSAIFGPVVIATGSMAVAIVLGTIAAYLRGSVDWVVGRGVDLLLSLPVMLVAIVVAGIFGAGYWVTVLMLIALFSPSDIRIIRAGVTEQAPRPYVEAAQMLSLPTWRIMFRHIVPNVWPLIVTNFMLNLAIALVTLSSLSFLGIGVAPGTADWGRQITDGRAIFSDNPAMMLTPTILIVVTAMAINFLGDQLGERVRSRGIQ